MPEQKEDVEDAPRMTIKAIKLWNRNQMQVFTSEISSIIIIIFFIYFNYVIEILIQLIYERDKYLIWQK